ncbi:MAG: GIY-YIG nuclease family protein [Candidatus Wildermuthbacteria bacterium]|nr:GIY-YIG nuclease family protein [Candidatus Wildermuthbacteria bacterium]
MEKFRFISKEKLKELPKGPGVYALAAKDEPLYIGKAANLQDRVKTHFKQPNYRDHLFLDQVKRVGYIATDSDIDALLLESSLIKKTLPKYNVMWKDGKKYFYVGITKESLPRVFLTHQPTVTKLRLVQTKRSLVGAKYIGPFVDGKAIKQVLRLLRRAFPYYTAKTHGPKPCSWCHLNLCPGPNPNPKAYKNDLKKLVGVLEGKRVSILRKIKKDMEEASKNQQYEEAAKFRNQLWALERVLSHSSAPLGFGKLSGTKELQKELQKIFNTKKKISRVEAYDISNIQGKESTGSMVTFIDGKPAKAFYRKFKIHITGKPNDFAMLQETISRRLNHPEWPYPDLMVIDGGKPQLSAALSVLTKSDLVRGRTREQILVAAIAKQHNELFLPGRPKPILLKTLSQPVQNLILHIRDEAHRFAITYHKHLRKHTFFGHN